MNYTGQNLQSWFNSATASDCSTWVSDAAGAGWGGSFSSRFSGITTDELAGVNRWKPFQRSLWIALLDELATSKTNNIIIDFGDYTTADGFSVVCNSGVAKDEVTYHFDFSQFMGVIYLASFWKTTKTKA